MALTATAQQKVQEDIIRSLGIRGCSVLTQSFNRANLHYEVRPKMKNVLENMVAFIQTQGANACGIIYCSSRDKCENLAKTLREDHDLGAYHYHAGMSKGDRRKIQEGWQERKFEIIVATVSYSTLVHAVEAHHCSISGGIWYGVSRSQVIEPTRTSDANAIPELTNPMSDVSCVFVSVTRS